MSGQRDERVGVSPQERQRTAIKLLFIGIVVMVAGILLCIVSHEPRFGFVAVLGVFPLAYGLRLVGRGALGAAFAVCSLISAGINAQAPLHSLPIDHTSVWMSLILGIVGTVLGVVMAVQERRKGDRT